LGHKGVKMQKKKIRKFTVIFEKASEGEGYIVSVPALPGCMTQGDTFEEAEEMVKDAIKCYCESLRKHNEIIPKEADEIIEIINVPIAV